MKIYKYKSRPIKQEDILPSGTRRQGAAENITGSVQNKTASDLEERMARAFDKINISYEFRARISSLAIGERRLISQGANLPGELEIDHLVVADQVIPVLVDGQISHFMSPYQRLEDEARTDAINSFGRASGWHEVVRVPFTELGNQEAADLVARRIANGVYIPTSST